MICAARRLISYWKDWLFFIYMILLQDFVPEWNSCPSMTRSGTSKHFWLCHINKYRAIRGKQSELALGQKSPQYYFNTSGLRWLIISLSPDDSLLGRYVKLLVLFLSLSLKRIHTVIMKSLKCSSQCCGLSHWMVCVSIQPTNPVHTFIRYQPNPLIHTSQHTYMPEWFTVLIYLILSGNYKTFSSKREFPFPHEN